MSKSNVVELGAEFDSLFQLHHDAVYRYCQRRLGTLDAEDAAAEVFTVAWRRLKEARADNNRAWLIAIAYRVIGNHYRSRRRRRGLVARLAGVAYEPLVETLLEFEILHRALAELRPTDRELLQLSSWDGLTRIEIAHVLGIKENAVDQRLHRARSRLKARIDSLNTGSPETKEAPA